jgi:hypothetical protein
MKQKIPSALRETAKLFGRYIGVAACFGVAAAICPIGLHYVTNSQSVVLSVALGLGFIMSLFFWRLTAVRVSTIAQTASPAPAEIQGATAPSVFGLGELVFPELGTNMTFAYFCTTYPAEESQSTTKTHIESPTSAPEVQPVDANLH